MSIRPNGWATRERTATVLAVSSDPREAVRQLDPAALLVEFQADDAGVLRVSVTGEIDFASAPSLQARLIAAREREHTAKVILDITGVPFIDSTGLQALLHLKRELAKERGALVLLGATEEVMRVLQITGVDNHLVLASSLPQAHDLVRRPPSPQAGEDEI